MRGGVPIFIGVVLAILMQLVIGPIAGPFAVKLLMDIGINIILAVSLNLVNGFTGQFSIGHAGFMRSAATSPAPSRTTGLTRSGAGRRFTLAGFRAAMRCSSSRVLPAHSSPRAPVIWSACRRCDCAATISRS
jgi:ABC-type branched-subunit amino acid transport system permease subunit